MYVCIPSMDRWESNPIYNKIVQHAKDKSRFLFFVRPYQLENYRKSMPDVSVIPIGEECTNIGTTRRWIDNYMRNCGMDIYCQMDDRVCSLGYVYFVDGKAKITDKNYNNKNVDCILDMMDRTTRCIIEKYPQTAILSIRRRGFANSVSCENIVDLNSSIAAIDDVLIVNTTYPLENIPETDRFAEDANFSVTALSKGRFIGVMQLFVRDTDEKFPSRCESNKYERHRFILEELPEKLYARYNCSEWLTIQWNSKREFPVFKLNCKKSPVPRIKLSEREIIDMLEEQYEHCN